MPKHVNLSYTNEFIKIICMSNEKLFQYLLDVLQNQYGYIDIVFDSNPDNGYIFARGTLPVCLCAHMDKVYSYKRLTRKEVLFRVRKNRKGSIIDKEIFSLKGIGGDDRCGIYSIIDMLNKGHRPSVAFFMGEEVGCRGSHNFVSKYSLDFMEGINAFIQIDRRGDKDCVSYQDKSMKLVDEICKFDFKFAYGSSTDIRVLMNAYKISAVNLSSGYHFEHMRSAEYISLKEFNYLLYRLNNILNSNIFNTRYECKFEYNTLYSSAHYLYENIQNPSSIKFVTNEFRSLPVLNKNTSKFKQLSIFDGDEPGSEALDVLGVCEYCGETVFKEQLIDVYDDSFSMSVCSDCKRVLIKQGYVECTCCGELYKSSWDVEFCPFCGNVIE